MTNKKLGSSPLSIASQPARQLKKKVSNVSIDSQGFASLQSPKASKASPEDPLRKGKSSAASHEAEQLPQPSFNRRRAGQTIAQQPRSASTNIRNELGIGGGMKKPAGQKSKQQTKIHTPKPKSKPKPASKSLRKGIAPASYPRGAGVKRQKT